MVRKLAWVAVLRLAVILGLGAGAAVGTMAGDTERSATPQADSPVPQAAPPDSPSPQATPPEPAPGQTAPAPADPSAVPTYTSVRSLGDAVTLAELSNGLTVIVEENHVAPVATVRCYVRNTGSAFESPYLGAGLSHVLEHVVAGGSTTRRGEAEIERIIDSFGGATNAYTSTHVTTYFIDCPAKDVATALELLADSMQRIRFEPAEFARELKVVRQELRDGEADRRRVQWKMLNELVYTVHPARLPVIGYLDVLDQTTNETIMAFYRERYVPNNQVVVVVGDVRTDDVLALVAKNWAGTPRGRATPIVFPVEPAQVGPREAVREMDGANYELALAWPTVDLFHEDLYALDVAAYILGEGESSRLADRLKHREQTALGVAAESVTPHYAPGFFAVLATCPAETWQQAQQAILEEIDRLRREPVGAAELAKAKKQKAAELVFGRQTVAQAAESLGRSFISAGDPMFDRRYVENIQRVTAEEIQRAARRWLVPERLNRVVIAPPGGAKRTATQAAATAGEPMRKARLDNDLRVLVKRHAALPMVTMQAFVLAGNLVDDDATAGRSALLAELLDKGTESRSAREIAEYFDSIGGRLSMSAGRFTISGSVTALKDDFPEAAALMAECFTRPALPTDEFEKAKLRALRSIARRADSPQAEAFEAFYQALPAESPYHVIQGGTRESVERLSRDDLAAYHAAFFVPNNMVVAVVGDIDPEAAVELVRKHFGALAAKPDFRPPDWNRPNTIAENRSLHKQTGKPTAMVLMGYPGASILDAKDHAALLVLDAVTSGYQYPGGWLHNELRGEGLVYMVHATLLSGPSPGFFVVMAQTHPEAVGEVVRRIERNIERARRGEFDEEEVRRAIEMIVALHAQENTTIAEQAAQAAVDELFGLGFDYDQSFDARIRAVSREQVAEIARRLLNRRVLVTCSPRPAPAPSAASESGEPATRSE